MSGDDGDVEYENKKGFKNINVHLGTQTSKHISKKRMSENP